MKLESDLTAKRDTSLYQVLAYDVHNPINVIVRAPTAEMSIDAARAIVNRCNYVQNLEAGDIGPAVATAVGSSDYADTVTPKWEYDILKMMDYSSTEGVTYHLNALGAEGWELINVRNLGDVDVFYFKRPKPA